MSAYPILFLLAAVILVNGWTDAPNAIAAPVAAGVLPFPLAAALAAVCNLLGVVCTARVSDAVARTLYSIADFGPQALTALSAALSATVLWAVFAWRFGVPTSESHALVAGLTGSALALGTERLHLAPLAWVGLGLILSLALGFLLGRLFRARLPHCREALYRRGQILGAALTAFLHGAQDGQKFLGVMALILALDCGGYSLPHWASRACALLMALGTLIGGRRIIDTVGRKLVTLDPRAGFAAEAGCAAALALCTLWGFPVSTTHAKTAAILGAGAAPDGKVAGSLGLAWLLTFPACGFLAFFLVKCLLLW
ncbi:inorganic phosphate transporter [Vermiculatibacterium agrestimuris]|uniref:inorganic phosphate transporter n=1 Tax=Vermiculatibacterium agrestimuris TaxID=2941519 RepID=UPI00203B8541|nr:inorganic phosphate transporter [Vermiculatibacterium agrestimuris]